MAAGPLEQQDDDDVVARDNPAAHRFEIWLGDDLAGFLAYRELGAGAYALDHTEVGPPFAHRGLAGRLVEAALDEIRSRGGSVLPYCPFVRSWLAENPAYLGLVPADHRERFGPG